MRADGVRLVAAVDEHGAGPQHVAPAVERERARAVGHELDDGVGEPGPADAVVRQAALPAAADDRKRAPAPGVELQVEAPRIGYLRAEIGRLGWAGGGHAIFSA